MKFQEEVVEEQDKLMHEMMFILKINKLNVLNVVPQN